MNPLPSRGFTPSQPRELRFSTLIARFTSDVITPLVTRAQGKTSIGLGVQLGTKGQQSTFINFGDFISAIIYFVVFMTVIYFVLVLPYKAISARRGTVVFGDPAPAKSCPACLSDDLPMGATKCRYCTSDLPAIPSGTGDREPGRA